MREKRIEAPPIGSFGETEERIDPVWWSRQWEIYGGRGVLQEYPGATGHLRHYDCEEARQSGLDEGVRPSGYWVFFGGNGGWRSDGGLVEQHPQVRWSQERVLHLRRAESRRIWGVGKELLDYNVNLFQFLDSAFRNAWRQLAGLHPCVHSKWVLSESNDIQTRARDLQAVYEVSCSRQVCECREAGTAPQ